MTDVPSDPMPATLYAALRYAIGILGPIAVQKGWLGESDLPNISALTISAATVAYGLWKTHQRQKALASVPVPFGRSVIR